MLREDPEGTWEVGGPKVGKNRGDADAAAGAGAAKVERGISEQRRILTFSKSPSCPIVCFTSSHLS